ncbi:MAG: hypothetical protein KIT10_14625 [Flavobacteriales bacterium]|nr:hypothetical protein [Flavobacteriales bacterium]
MPVQVFDNANALLAYLTAELPTQGNQEITAARHREVMHSTVLSLLNIVNGLPGSTVLAFPAWESGTTYTGGEETVVRHADKLWLFVSVTDQTGVEPGTNGLVWQNISAVQLAHLKNRDEFLAQFTNNQVSAAAIRAHLDNPGHGAKVHPVSMFLDGFNPDSVVGAAETKYFVMSGTAMVGSVVEVTIDGWQVVTTPDVGDLVVAGPYSVTAEWALITLNGPMVIGQRDTLAQILTLSGATGAGLLRHETPVTRVLDTLFHFDDVNPQMDVAMQHAGVRITAFENIVLRPFQVYGGPQQHMAFRIEIICANAAGITVSLHGDVVDAGDLVTASMADGDVLLIHIEHSAMTGMIHMASKHIVA